jgi:hypothetical protein
MKFSIAQVARSNGAAIAHIPQYRRAGPLNVLPARPAHLA